MFYLKNNIKLKLVFLIIVLPLFLQACSFAPYRVVGDSAYKFEKTLVLPNESPFDISTFKKISSKTKGSLKSFAFKNKKDGSEHPFPLYLKNFNPENIKFTRNSLGNIFYVFNGKTDTCSNTSFFAMYKKKDNLFVFSAKKEFCNAEFVYLTEDEHHNTYFYDKTLNFKEIINFNTQGKPFLTSKTQYDKLFPPNKLKDKKQQDLISQPFDKKNKTPLKIIFG